MRITDLLSASSIDLNAKPLNKKEAIEQAVKLMAASGNITDIEAYTKQVIAREEAQLVLERELPYHTANAVR